MGTAYSLSGDLPGGRVVCCEPFVPFSGPGVPECGVRNGAEQDVRRGVDMKKEKGERRSLPDHTTVGGDGGDKDAHGSKEREQHLGRIRTAEVA